MSRGNLTSLFVTLSTEEKATLERWKRCTTIAQGLNRRARIVLLRAAGLPVTQIATAVGMSRRHCSLWIQRFQTDRVAGLYRRRARHSAASS